MPTVIPEKEKNPDGLHKRYNVTKVDGDEDPNAVYFVLRLDSMGDDPEHLRACQAAARVYARQIKDHIPGLAADLNRLLDMEEAELSNRMATNGGTGREVTEENLITLGGEPPKEE